TAQGRGHRLVLASPATLTLAGENVDIAGLSLAVDSGKLTLAGHAGQRLALKATASAIPLSVAELASPGLGLSGSLDGEFALSGTPQSPAGDWRVKISRLV